VSTAPNAPQEKLNALCSLLAELEGVAVAFSGGVDSALLLTVAHKVLGDRAVAFTLRSALAPARELRDAQGFCAMYGIEHVIIDLEMVDLASFVDNPPDRCYLCKRIMFERIIAAAASRGLAAAAEGSNLDDDNDYRPGLKALTELGVLSPLKAAGLTKKDIRILSRELGLPTWDKPSCACLATRLPFGTPLTQEALQRIDAAEDYLIASGLRQVRVRLHGDVARIECDEEGMGLFTSPAFQRTIYETLKVLGFAFVSLDLGGFVSGSMNQTMTD